MKNKDYNLAFKIILFAGDAKNHAMNAIDYSNRYDFEAAKEELIKAQKEIKNAHKVQTDLIQSEVQGIKQEVSIVLVHSQDHLSMATTAIENAKQNIVIMEKMQTLEKRLAERGDSI